jgi:hypothetical protein
MSDIEFDADIQGNPHYASRTSVPGSMQAPQFNMHPGESNVGMVRWLIRHGIISGESSAKFFLIGLICFNFVIAGLIMYFFVLR